MNCKQILSGGLAVSGTFVAGQSGAGALAPETKPWNVVVIMFDDVGYGDFGCYGGDLIRTPRMDAMAAEGMRFTDFYVTTSVCTPSRAAFMTGRYPKRAGLTGLPWPHSTIGLPESEITIATAVKENGYSTALIGKWHLGHLPQYLPNAHGFDYWYGMPYPNDMDGKHPLNEIFLKYDIMKEPWPPLPLCRNGEVIEQPTDVNLLTQKYTRETVQYIREHKDKPFFLTLAHAMPHEWIGASEDFRGKSAAGLYGDAVEELDWSVGQVLDVLKETGLDQHTLVIVCNDNGAAAPLENATPDERAAWEALHAKAGLGSNAPLRGGKQEYYDGGIRIPFIARAPGLIAPGTVCSRPALVQDLFTTILKLTGTPLPDDRVIDGKDLLPVLTGSGERPQETLFFGAEVTQACRKGPWKLVRYTRHMEKLKEEVPDVRLYNLDDDIGEQNNVADEHPDVVKELLEEISAHERDMEANSE